MIESVRIPAIPKDTLTAISGARTTIVVFRDSDEHLYNLYRSAVEDCKVLNEAVVTDVRSGNQTVSNLFGFLRIVRFFRKENLLNDRDVEEIEDWAHDALTVLQSIRF